MSNNTKLPRAIVAGVAGWQALRKGRWSTQAAHTAADGLKRAVQVANEHGDEVLVRALSDLALGVALLAEGQDGGPSAEQLRRLAQLEAPVLAALRQLRDSPDALAADSTPAADPGKRILVLAPELPIWTELADRLRADQQQVQRFSDPQQLVRQLRTPGLSAVLIDQDFLMDLGTVADQLEGHRGADALGATVVYFNRSRDPANRELALSSGADTSLEGDDADYLRARVEELIGVGDQQENLRVLIFEDDRFQALYCEAVLRKQGVNVFIADSSKNALADIRRFAPDSILMDLHMPEIDGMQLTAMIRHEPDLALLPIVFLTAEQSERSRYDALRAGGDDYLTKPVRPRHLVTAVVTRARRARSLSRQLSQHQERAHRKLVHSGEMVAMLRNIGVDRPRDHALMLCAADSARYCAQDAHSAVEQENLHLVASQLRAELAPDERIAPWRGGLLMLVDWQPDEELIARGKQLQALATESLPSLDGVTASVAIVPLKGESLPSAETLLDLAERTLAVARHAGGNNVRLALAETQSDLSAEVSLAIQKALALEPSAQSTSLLFQPIVPLHGAGRAQYHAHLGLRVDIGGERVITRRQWYALARRTGRANGLDRYAVSEVLAQIARRRKGLSGLRVVLACAVESLLDAGFRKHLIEALEQHQLSDPGLILSIDHSEAMLMQKQLQQARVELRAARVLLGFGRVGLEAESDQSISVLHPELVSVDAAAVTESTHAPSILKLARDSGAEVLAHFIPDAKSLARLFAMGIDYGMGSFIGLPNARMDYDFGEQ